MMKLCDILGNELVEHSKGIMTSLYIISKIDSSDKISIDKKRKYIDKFEVMLEQETDHFYDLKEIMDELLCPIPERVEDMPKTKQELAEQLKEKSDVLEKVSKELKH